MFPRVKYRDPEGPDRDVSNGGYPHSRFIWEMEYDHRGPVGIRERGLLYMQHEYTRLFLAGKFYAPADDGTYKAALVLWGRQEGSDVTCVMDAVSFGTADLSQEDKDEFSQGSAKRLVGVRADQWRRPQDEDDPSRWSMTIPYHAFFYKVAKKRKKRSRTVVYVLQDMDDEADLGDFFLNIRKMVFVYENMVAPNELPEVDSSSEEESA